jgi:hypothetical protein
MLIKVTKHWVCLIISVTTSKGSHEAYYGLVAYITKVAISCPVLALDALG